MASDFGGFEESSRAFPNDLEYKLDNWRVESELTDEGRQFVNSEIRTYTCCVFNGSLSQAFSSLENSSDIVLLCRIFVLQVDDDENSDYGSTFVKKDATKNCVLQLYKLKELLLILANQDQYGSALIPQLVESEVKEVIRKSQAVYIFHSEPNSKFKGSYTRDALYYLKSSFFDKNGVGDTRGLKQLSMPNLVERFSAALLMLCEMESKSGLLVINYTALSDMLPHTPFLTFIRSSTGLKKLFQFFQQFPINSKVSNSIINNSNLFV